MKATLDLEFEMGSRVVIDNGDITGLVIGVLLRGRAFPPKLTNSDVLYEVSWFANGIQQTAYFDSWRLEKK